MIYYTLNKCYMYYSINLVHLYNTGMWELHVATIRVQNGFVFEQREDILSY